MFVENSLLLIGVPWHLIKNVIGRAGAMAQSVKCPQCCRPELDPQAMLKPHTTACICKPRAGCGVKLETDGSLVLLGQTAKLSQ